MSEAGFKVVTSNDEVRKAIYALQSAYCRSRDETRQSLIDSVVAMLEAEVKRMPKGGFRD